MEYDDAGRQTKIVQNWTAGSSSSSSSSSSSGAFESDDANVTVLTAYNADGNVSNVTAVNSLTGDQTTQYVYDTTLSDSGIASSLVAVATRGRTPPAANNERLNASWADREIHPTCVSR